MSDIPRARFILRQTLRAEMDPFVRKGITLALNLLSRERPQFKAARTLPPMTQDQVELARRLRERRWPINRIARHLGTNIGRVSEAINGLRDGI